MKREPLPKTLLDDVDLPNVGLDEEDDDGIVTEFDPEVSKITGLKKEDFDNV